MSDSDTSQYPGTHQAERLMREAIDQAYATIETSFSRVEFEIALLSAASTRKLISGSKKYLERKEEHAVLTKAQEIGFVRKNAKRINSAAQAQYPGKINLIAKATQVSIPSSSTPSTCENTMALNINTPATSINAQAAQATPAEVIGVVEAVVPAAPSPSDAVAVEMTSVESATQQLETLGRAPEQEVIAPASAKDQAEACMSLEQLERASRANKAFSANSNPSQGKTTMNDTIFNDAQDADIKTTTTLKDKALDAVGSVGSAAGKAVSAVASEAKHATRLVTNGMLLGAGSLIGMMLVRKGAQAYDAKFGGLSGAANAFSK